MRRRTLLLAALLTATAGLLFAPGMTGVVFNSDEAFLATEGQVLEAGGRLYHDVVDRKPPVVPLLYAGVRRLTGTGELWPMRLVGIAARSVTAMLLAYEARRRWSSRAGIWAGFLFLASAAALPPSDAQAANFEIFMLPTMVAALTLGARGFAGSSGAMLAISTLTKQTAAVGLLPLAVLAWRCQPRSGLVRLALGFTFPIVATASWFGADAFLFWNYLGTGDYLDVGGVLGFALRQGAERTAMFLLANAAIVAPVVAGRRAWRQDLDLWLWLATAAIGVATGLRFFEHYYLQLIPILCLLAARPLDELTPRLAAATGAVVAATALFFQGAAFAYASGKDEEQLETVGAYVQAQTVPEARVLVWGHWPELYWHTDRLPATRFLTTGFLTGHSGGRPPDRVGTEYATDGAWEMFEADLEANPPALVIVPTELRSAPHYRPGLFPRFADWLDANYRLVARMEDVEVYSTRVDQPATAIGAGASSTVSVGTSSAFFVAYVSM